MSKHRSVSDSFIISESEAGDNSDPMSSLANLADIMLVFACGLMLALVAYWNIDMPTVKEIVKTNDALIDENEASESTDEGFQDMGRVYKDPETGKMYILEDEE